jgi:hypothetical protein
MGGFGGEGEAGDAEGTVRVLWDGWGGVRYIDGVCLIMLVYFASVSSHPNFSPLCPLNVLMLLVYHIL